MAEMYPDESIYNLIPQDEIKAAKMPRYTSRFRGMVKEEMQKNRALNKTMGPAKVDVPSPEKFLQKHSKELKETERGDILDFTERPFQYEDHDRRKPPVPARTEKPVMGIQTKKNFINSNAVEMMMAVPKKPKPIYVDTKRGDKQLLETSGLVPKFVHKKDFGETPEYLVRRNEETRIAHEEYEAYVKERLRQGAMKQLSDEERQTVLQGLKKNWEELSQQYQGLSVVIDTVPKKNRKERLENEMKQLEKDIEMIEKHKTIYIANN
ncbi:enkurin isoform X1 [Polypterus senegalus]|uniref:enkurin isoform X1 n=1 Tax=Polypterus senegalus TaxID=55291 RepID=UPI00196325AA|nr:enkurin isoform X1 [Polypterus senegalus]